MASSNEVSLARCYRHAPRVAALRVRILALDRRKPPSVPETWCDELPTTSRPVAGSVHWSTAGLGLLLWILFFADDFVITLLVGLWGCVRARVTGHQLPRTYRFLELDSEGVSLSDNKSAVYFIQYAILESVQTYLDECMDADARRGVILGIEGGRAFTLELGENTVEAVNAICHYAQVEVLHSRCSWQYFQG